MLLLVAAASWGASALICIGLLIAGHRQLERLWGWIWPTHPVLESEARVACGATLTILWSLLVPSIVALMARDAVLRRLLARQISRARCPNCGFSLLGLPVAAGTVRCPECGTDIVLQLLGLVEDDLIPKRDVAAAAAAGAPVEQP